MRGYFKSQKESVNICSCIDFCFPLKRKGKILVSAHTLPSPLDFSLQACCRGKYGQKLELYQRKNISELCR